MSDVVHVIDARWVADGVNDVTQRREMGPRCQDALEKVGGWRWCSTLIAPPLEQTAWVFDKTTPK